jgi:hypothetical protein
MTLSQTLTSSRRLSRTMNRVRAIHAVPVLALALVALGFAACKQDDETQTGSDDAGTDAETGMHKGSGTGTGTGKGSGRGTGSGTGTGVGTGSGTGTGTGGGVDSGMVTTPGNATSVAGGMANLQSLLVTGSNLYWVNGQNTAGGMIQSVPTAGGTPTAVLTAANLQGDLATDGTKLYFTALTAGADTFEIDSIGLDGSGQTTLASGLQLLSELGLSSHLFVVGSSVYAATEDPGTGLSTVIAVPLMGGAASSGLVTGLGPGPNNTFSGLRELVDVDPSGIYFTYVAAGVITFGYVPLTGGAYQTVTSASGNPVGGDFFITGGNAYFLVDQSLNTVLTELTSATAPTTALATYMAQAGTALVGDSMAAYALSNYGNNAGVYRIDLSTYAETSLLNISSGTEPLPSPSLGALDGTSVYYVAGGGGSYSIWKLPR